jgi:alpha(1,3/1,4) fucosyltransferase
MKETIAFISIYSSITEKNFLFENRTGGIGDDLLLPFHELKDVWNKIGITVCTPDMVKLSKITKFIFLDTPDQSNEYYQYAVLNKKKIYLIISESSNIHSRNIPSELHKDFLKIFTYQESVIDNLKYFKLNYSFSFPSDIKKHLASKQKFCVMISGNKFSKLSNELYSKRIEAIKWFEKYHPEHFDLFGIGWDRVPFFRGTRLNNLINKRGVLTRLFPKPYPSYLGKINRKSDILVNYRFSICYENFKDDPGYVTEKIFDCFFAACIPIYLGSDDITDHIPKECFIDRGEYSSYESLFEYLYSMRDDEYKKIVFKISDFLNSEKSYPFSIKYFVDLLTKEVLSPTT